MGTLYITVCSIDLSSHGKAHILVYADGQSTLSCGDTGPSPTAAHVQKPAATPVQLPTASPAQKPAASPVQLPTASPIGIPTKSPASGTQCQDSDTRFTYESGTKTCKYVSKKPTIHQPQER
jgi:hypothetical protein